MPARRDQFEGVALCAHLRYVPILPNAQAWRTLGHSPTKPRAYGIASFVGVNPGTYTYTCADSTRVLMSFECGRMLRATSRRGRVAAIELELGMLVGAVATLPNVDIAGK